MLSRCERKIKKNKFQRRTDWGNIKREFYSRWVIEVWTGWIEWVTDIGTGHTDKMI